MIRALRVALVWVALAAPAAALAQEMLTEVIPLGYRSAADLLPILKPLVPPPGTVSGLQSTLVVQTTPENLETIKHLLAELDRAPSNLFITVRRKSSGQTTVSKGEGHVAIVAGNRGAGGRGGNELTAGARILSTRSQSDGESVEQIRVLEGEPAWVEFGRSVPLAERSLTPFGRWRGAHESIQYRDLTSGFFVRARLHADRVTLDISPHRERPSPIGGGAIDLERARTTVSARLGEWVPIAASTSQFEESTGGTVYRTRDHDAQDHTLLLKVERID